MGEETIKSEKEEGVYAAFFASWKLEINYLQGKVHNLTKVNN